MTEHFLIKIVRTQNFDRKYFISIEPPPLNRLLQKQIGNTLRSGYTYKHMIAVLKEASVYDQ